MVRVSITGGSDFSPALYSGRVVFVGLMLLFLSFRILYGVLTRCIDATLRCTAMPFTRCDVPPPLKVSSSRSILSYPSDVGMPGRILDGMANPC